MWMDLRASFLTSWTFARGETGHWSQARATFHHGSIVKETPRYQSHTYGEHSGRMLVLFLARSMGKQPTWVFFTVCTTASRPGSCYSSQWLFFPVVCGNNGTQRPILHSDRGLLFLATAWAAQDISQSFGCLWNIEPWVHLGGGLF